MVRDRIELSTFRSVLSVGFLWGSPSGSGLVGFLWGHVRAGQPKNKASALRLIADPNETAPCLLREPADSKQAGWGGVQVARRYLNTASGAKTAAMARHQMMAATACEAVGPPSSNGRMVLTVAVRGWWSA